MDVAKAFGFVFEDERWVGKIGIGAAMTLLSMLLIPIPLLVGYSVGITRNVRDGLKHPLPEWDDFGRLFQDGLSVIVAQIVYTLPFWLLLCLGVFATIGFGSLTEMNENVAAAGVVTTISVISCLVILFAIALMFISPAIVIQYVRTGDLGACFRFGQVLGIARDHIGDILIVFLATFAASLVLSTVTGVLSFIPCLGQIAAFLIGIIAGPYFAAISGHLYGQIAAKIDANKAGLSTL